jgi:hypothetical protein
MGIGSVARISAKCLQLTPLSEYSELFCDCYRWEEPKVLANGKDIAFPAGWTHEQALAWRAKNGFAAPTPVYPWLQ